MAALDWWFHSFRWWRRMRGKVWERWRMTNGRLCWWGPLDETTLELESVVTNRLFPSIAKGEERETLAWAARPAFGCSTIVATEDYRSCAAHH